MKKLLAVATLNFVVANGLFLWIEVLPWIRAATRSPYDPAVLDLADRHAYRMGIYRGSRRVGSVVGRSRRLAAGYELRATVEMELAAGIFDLLGQSGASGPAQAEVVTRLDRRRRLERFEATLRIGSARGGFVAERIGDILRLRLKGRPRPIAEKPYDPHTMVVNALVPALDRADLEEGKTWKIQLCDLSLPGFVDAFSEVLFKVGARETIEAGGRRIEATRVTAYSRWGHRVLTLWFDAEGELVRQDFYGWSLVRE